MLLIVKGELKDKHEIVSLIREKVQALQDSQLKVERVLYVDANVDLTSDSDLRNLELGNYSSINKYLNGLLKERCARCDMQMPRYKCGSNCKTLYCSSKCYSMHKKDHEKDCTDYIVETHSEQQPVHVIIGNTYYIGIPKKDMQFVRYDQIPCTKYKYIKYPVLSNGIFYYGGNIEDILQVETQDYMIQVFHLARDNTYHVSPCHSHPQNKEYTYMGQHTVRGIIKLDDPSKPLASN